MIYIIYNIYYLFAYNYTHIHINVCKVENGCRARYNSSNINIEYTAPNLLCNSFIFGSFGKLHLSGSYMDITFGKIHQRY